MLENGQHISHYKILSPIGAGGMGEVFPAEDTRLDRRVALKILPANLALEPDRMRRFVQEAKATSALNHPNIITIYEIGAERDANFIAAEYIEGETLRERLKENSFSVDGCLEVGIQIASALQAAHSVNIVHRDIKPENIMIRPDGLVKTLDFGIAKLTEKKAEIVDAEEATAIQAQTALGMIIGTAAYMSPEQAQGKQIDARSDIFSFGVVFYEMLTGQQPFAGETAMDAIGRILHKEPTPLNQLLPKIPAELERIIDNALCKDCEERYQTAKDLLIDLKELKEELSFQSKLKRASQTNKETEAQTQIIKAITDENARTTGETTYANSIAVLPFADMSADADNEYFCDGLAEELLNALAKIEDLKVAARTSSFSFKNKNAEISQIGQTLNVKTILEGSVRKSSNKLRITVQLINASDGYHLWSERYDREMQDIFDVQDEITLAVVEALKVKLLGDEKADLIKRYTENTEVYELYLKGLYQFNKDNGEGWLKAMEYFERAIAIEPDYAPAFAGIGLCYLVLCVFGEFSPQETIPKWKAVVNRALELDDKLAEAHMMLGGISFYYEWKWQEAEKEYRRGIELNPNNANFRYYFGLFLVSRGRCDEAVAEGRRAVELDPLSLIVNLYAGLIYLLSDRADDALKQVARMIEIEPNFHGAYWLKGSILLRQGNHAEATRTLEKSVALGGTPIVKSYLGAAYGLSGEREKALGIINELLETGKKRFTAAFNVARAYAGLSEMDAAYEWLEKTVEQRNGEVVFFDAALKTGMRSGWHNNFSRDPRVSDLLRRTGLAIEEEQNKTTNEPNEAQTAILSPAATDRQETLRSIAKTDEKALQTDKPKANRKWWLFGLLGLILLASGFFAYSYFTTNSKQIESIAVLPFENASGNADLDYMSDGVSESVIDRLSQLPQLKVIARSSSFRYRGQNLNLQEIANALDVDAIITGRVMPRGDSYQIRVELVDVRDNKQLWGENFNRKASDVQILQADISREIAENLRLRLSGAEQRQLASQETTNPQAYELLLKGRFYHNKAGIENFHRAAEYYEHAVAIDPNYALAYAELAEDYRQGAGKGLDPAQRRIKREAAVERALQLNPNLAEAHSALADLKRDAWQWQEAEAEYKRAIELNPNFDRAHMGYAMYLSMMKRHDEAIAEIKRAREISPLSLIINASVGSIFLYARRYDEAIEAMEKRLELEQNLPVPYWRLGMIYEAKGMYAEAITNYQQAMRLGGNQTFSLEEPRLGAIYAKIGERGKAEEILRKIKTSQSDASILRRHFAILYDALGMRDEALALLEKSYAERDDYGLPYIAVEPAYDNLRSDPRFADLLRRMNLPQ